MEGTCFPSSSVKNLRQSYRKKQTVEQRGYILQQVQNDIEAPIILLDVGPVDILRDHL